MILTGRPKKSRAIRKDIKEIQTSLQDVVGYTINYSGETPRILWRRLSHGSPKSPSFLR